MIGNAWQALSALRVFLSKLQLPSFGDASAPKWYEIAEFVTRWDPTPEKWLYDPDDHDLYDDAESEDE